ncbi:MAG: addiction module protein [Desulfobacterales bacterium]|uniref:Addiction module protein n=1 Tax=Candidatus Desulfatibia vada TaxID=2841696 RepID=A0A8J6P1W1_9BACT|nr:addiction module protein [Candidatus Desulfatibia vada]MBL7218156.1 addiction module protein [Desulfobacteraceae bacterium]
MDVQIPLDSMTTLDKLRVLERIWDDLQRRPEEVPSPPWHGDVLQNREDRIKEGSSQFLDWTEAKARIRDQTK